jgi:hypothetical protein
MEQAGLINSIFFAAETIDFGRKGLSTDGKEHEGRISYEDGISSALTAFQKASNLQSKTAANLETIILAEYTFIQQELQYCSEADTDTRSSLTHAVQDFDDAFRCLKAVQGKHYKTAEETYPQKSKYRYQNLPKDSFHIACIAHRTRIRNILRSPGINMIEKALLNQRATNMKTAQTAYTELQKAALR